MPRRSPDLVALLLGSLDRAAREADPDLACRVLRKALDDLSSDASSPGNLDGLGAPRRPGGGPATAFRWDPIRSEARAYIAAVGLAEAARRYGIEPDTLTRLVNRRQSPGLGTRARLLHLVRN